MLISPREIIAECVEKITEEYFYIPAHQTIYTVLVELWNAGQGIDLITFTQVLRDRNVLETVGGASFVTSLFTFVPTSANVTYYLEIVREKYILRQIIAAATESVRRAYEEQDEVNSLLDEVEQKIFAVGEDRFKGQMPTMKEQVMGALESIEKLVGAQRRHHRNSDRIHRTRSHDERFARRRNDRDRRASEHGQNRAGHEHRRACRDQRQVAGRGFQPGNEQPAARATSALLTRAGEFAESARRIPGRARFSEPDGGRVEIGRSGNLHR